MKTISAEIHPLPPLPSCTLRSPRPKGWCEALFREDDVPAHTELVAQVVEGCPPPKLVALVARNNEASAHLIVAALLVAGITANQGALLAAGLPATLIALIASEAPPLQRPALTYPVLPQALALLRKLLSGPDASGTADVVIAAGGVEALAAALGAGGPVSTNAAECLLAITKLAPHRAAEIAVGAVPALLEAVNSGEEGSGGKAAAEHALSILMVGQAAVVTAVNAAGLNVAALKGLVLPPPSPS